MPRLAVLTCAEYRCIDGAIIKGKRFVEAFGDDIEYHVHTPLTESGVAASLKNADYAVIGIHGAANSTMYDLHEDGTSSLLLDVAGVKRLPRMPKLRLLIMLVCSAACGKEGNNLAEEFSRRIAGDGLVIANRYVITGTNSYYRSKNDLQGWVAYQNGKVVIPESAFPAKITMKDIRSIVEKYRSGVL